MLNKNIRHSSFETNSSSSHSVSISKKFLTEELRDIITINTNIEGYEGSKVIAFDEEYSFNWGIETYNDAKTKAAYLLLDAYLSEDTQRIQDIVNVLLECTKAELILYNFTNFTEESYIDHQSRGVANEVSISDIENFVFNRNSILTIDNDNH